MNLDDQDDTHAYDTVVVAPKDVPASLWLALALALIAAVVVLQFEQIDAWFAPRVETVRAEVRASMPEGRKLQAREVAKPVMPPRSQRAAGARADTTPPPSGMARAAPSAQVTTTPKPVDVPAPLPPLKPLYSAATAPPQASGPEGHAGIVEALRAGTLRPATGADIARWRSQYAMTHGRSPGAGLDDRLGMTEAYVIKGELTIPGGLSGANAVVFLLEHDVPYPRGDAGHSVILDMDSGACIGVICKSLPESR